MTRLMVTILTAMLVIGCASGSLTGSDKTHWSCYDAPRAKQQGGAPHKFNDAGSHICTKAELDAEGIPVDQRPADQR